MSREAFIVFEVEHWTMPDLLETLQLIDSDDDAAAFLSAYEAVCGDAVAEHNLRYMFSLLERDEGYRLSELFLVALPDERESIEPLHTFGRSSYGVLMERPVLTPRPKRERVYIGVDAAQPDKTVVVKTHTKKTHTKRPVKKSMTRVMMTEVPSDNGSSLLP